MSDKFFHSSEWDEAKSRWVKLGYNWQKWRKMERFGIYLEGNLAYILDTGVRLMEVPKISPRLLTSTRRSLGISFPERGNIEI